MRLMLVTCLIAIPAAYTVSGMMRSCWIAECHVTHFHRSKVISSLVSSGLESAYSLYPSLSKLLCLLEIEEADSEATRLVCGDIENVCMLFILLRHNLCTYEIADGYKKDVAIAT